MVDRLTKKLGTQVEYARHRGVSKQAVTAWKQEGRLVLVKGRIDFEATDRALAAAGRIKLETEADEPTPEELARRAVYDEGKTPHSKAEAERIKENYLALLRQLEYETKADKLVDREEYERAAFAAARVERDAWLNWPQRIAAELAAELGVDPVTLAVALERHVRAQLDDRARRSLEAAG